MKKLTVGAVIVTCLFFIVGGIAAYFGKLDKEIYIVVTGIIGGLASVVGLVGLLSKPSITASDMRGIEVELVQGLADTMKTVNEYETRISTNKQEIDRLERERAEIELLVRQASLKVFLEEKLKNIAGEIDKRVRADARLHELLNEYVEATSQVTKIDGQIQRSEKADLIQDILATVPHSNRGTGGLLDDMDSVAISVGSSYVKAVAKIIELIVVRYRQARSDRER